MRIFSKPFRHLRWSGARHEFVPMPSIFIRIAATANAFAEAMSRVGKPWS